MHPVAISVAKSIKNLAFKIGLPNKDNARFRGHPVCPRLPTMRATIPALAIATLFAGAALPAMAELGPCKGDAQETPLCGSGKRCVR